MFEHIFQQNIFLVMSLSHLPNFSQNQFEDDEALLDVLYVDTRNSRVLQLFDLHAKHSEKFPSRFGGHIISWKRGGISHILLRSARDVTSHSRPLICNCLNLGLYPFAYTDRYGMSCKASDASSTCQVMQWLAALPE
jgi:hypothetical protein